MKKFFRNNGLSIVLAVSFLAFWAAQAFTGWKVHHRDQTGHGGSPVSFPEYLASGHFWQATGENWESEFLQMGLYVVLTSFLYQKGSAESNDPDNNPPDPGARRHGFLYRNSLSLAFLALFLASLGVHAVGGWKESNEERAEHALNPESFPEFVGGPEFWFQSFQNWQSEFLAVLSIVCLSIRLRQDGSPESKKLDAPDSATGTE